ncbi:hypothetical protein [Pseudomonas sp. dw_358]|uniref:hypothetical protein n=1 Tax=Pseudomonas sp. dw_358 TaxID=2720083 RepID=UPI001BD38E6C|nr:hypothetical protein [Pseudomonas sp. dw_358]
MAKTQEQRNDELAERRAKFAEKELRHRVRPGIEQAMARVKFRSKGMSISEILQVNIMKMDMMDDAELTEHLRYPRHKIMVSESVAQAIYDGGLRSILSTSDREDDDEILPPKL